jgi:toxin ParE1/3/4
MRYRIRIESDAREDIQSAISWYNQQKKGLGGIFHSAIKDAFDKLKINPAFQIRYEEIHCMPVKKYPFMIHFTIDEPARLVVVRAVFHTSLDPEHWQKRK